MARTDPIAASQAALQVRERVELAGLAHEIERNAQGNCEDQERKQRTELLPFERRTRPRADRLCRRPHAPIFKPL